MTHSVLLVLLLQEKKKKGKNLVFMDIEYLFEYCTIAIFIFTLKINWMCGKFLWNIKFFEKLVKEKYFK